MRTTVRVFTVAAALMTTLSGMGVGHAGTGSAGNYASPAPRYILLPGGVVRLESAPGGNPYGWWCGGASFNPPAYVVAPYGAPLPQELHFPPGSTVDIDCSSSNSDDRAQVRLITLP
ncbi:hypothetical protein ACFWU5_28685 [Nocardia sp. NPDC058640]|uniref:hypothetical protein n=1 Tax=Nocardia sp. NPDC058640 TaxID=3346571 RepID=UPI00365140A0